MCLIIEEQLISVSSPWAGNKKHTIDKNTKNIYVYINPKDTLIYKLKVFTYFIWFYPMSQLSLKSFIRWTGFYWEAISLFAFLSLRTQFVQMWCVCVAPSSPSRVTALVPIPLPDQFNKVFQKQARPLSSQASVTLLERTGSRQTYAIGWKKDKTQYL